jgi:hypothetical protein
MTEAAARVEDDAKWNLFALASFVVSLLWVFVAVVARVLAIGVPAVAATAVIGSLLAIALGPIGRRQIDRGNGAQKGRGYASAGVALGWIGLLVAGAIIYWLFLPDGPP